MKKNRTTGSIVYSTNPDLKPEEISNVITPAPQHQQLRIQRETKHRAGKTVTVILGFIGSESALQELCKMLKSKCGTGGTVKDGEIILQGDFRDKVFNLLRGMNYHVKKAGG